MVRAQSLAKQLAEVRAEEKAKYAALLARWDRVITERERNLEFCACTFSEEGDVESMCGAHEDAVEQARADEKSRYAALWTVVDDALSDEFIDRDRLTAELETLRK